MATTTESQEILDQRDQFLDEEVQPASGGGSGRLLAALVLLTALIGGGLYAASQFGTGDSTPSLTDASMLFEVQPADLMVTVTEDGNVESANNVDVKCRVAGGSTILWIVKDGTEVKQGDKIVELDASTLEDQINTQKIAYNKAKATVVTAEKNFEVAKLAVREYLEGTYKQELETAEAQITIAEENLRSAKNALDYSQRMFQRGYISQLELEGQEFTVKRAELELSAANTAKNVLIEFTKVKMMEDLQSQVATTESTLQSERAAYDLEEAKLERLQQQVEFCTIVAPQDGMVVFANDQGGGRFGGGQQSVTIEEGAAVRDRQTLLRLPDLTRMQVNVKVHETKVEQIKIGMRARITIQGRQYQGAVTAIANQHEATSFFSGNVKEYATTVRIDGEVTNLRPGMTAEAEILIDHLKSVLTVPVSAVVEKRGEYLCWVAGSGKDYERRALVMGKSDDNYVEIKDGLKAGDRVIRNPRSFVAEATAMVTEDEEINVNDQFGEPTGSGSMGAGRGGPGPGAPGADGPGAGRPEGAGPGGPGAGGPGAGGPGGGPGGFGAGGPGGGPAGGPGGGGRGMGNLMDLDLDKDGKVSRDEAPEPMQNFFDRLDGNSDGFIDQQEADAMRRRFEQGGGRPGPPGGGPDGAPGGTQ